jgi:hypothetical protein
MEARTPQQEYKDLECSNAAEASYLSLNIQITRLSQRWQVQTLKLLV